MLGPLWPATQHRTLTAGLRRSYTSVGCSRALGNFVWGVWMNQARCTTQLVPYPSISAADGPRALHAVTALVPQRAAAGLAPGLDQLTPRQRQVARLIARGHTNAEIDRKCTRLNSSHMSISYAVFCLKKKIEAIPADIVRRD